MRLQKPKRLAAMLAVWIASVTLSTACATTHLKWWFLDGTQEKALIRRDPKTHAVAERLEWVQADGYLCLSPLDAEQAVTVIKAWDAEHP